MPALTCPGPETWKSFLLGAAPEAESLELEKHLQGCASCQEMMPTVQSKDLFVEVLKTQMNMPRLNNPHLEQLRKKLCSIKVSLPGSPDATPAVSAPMAPTILPTEAPSIRNGAPWLAPPEVPGEMGRLAHYRILRLMGKGGMGVVYQAEDTLLKRAVALKVMRPELARDEHNRQRFLREARAMAQLSHDNIVTVHQVGEERGMPFLAMPLLQGQTLEDRLRYEPKLPMHEALRIGREIALGLAVAHSHNVVHRDIKPGNLWLEESTGRIKILDFGLAWMEAPQGEQTMPGAMMGTPGYMAPEQAEGETDFRADLFSLGCVLYRMVTGEPPFKGGTALQMFRSILTETPQPAHEKNAAVPLPLSQLIQRLMSPKPADRPTSAPVVARVLETFQGQITTAPTHPFPTAILLAAEKMMAPQAVPAPVVTGRSVPLRPVWRRPPVLAAACVLVLLSAWLLWKILGPGGDDEGGNGKTGTSSTSSISSTTPNRMRQLVPLKPELVPAAQPQADNAWVLRPSPISQLKSWTIMSTFTPSQQSWSDLAIHGDHLALRGSWGTIAWRHWDFAARSEVKAPFAGVYDDVTPDGKTMLQTTLVLGSGYSTGLVDAKEPAKRRVTLLRELSTPPSSAISPDGQTLAMVHPATGVLSFWDIESGQRIYDAAGNASGSSVAWSADSKNAACVMFIDGGWVLCVVQPRGERPAGIWKLEAAFNYAKVVWSPDAKKVAVVNSTALPVLVELATGMALTVDVGEPISLDRRPFAWSVNSKHIALGLRNNDIVVWDPEQQNVVHRFKGHASVAAALLFWDEHTLVSAGYSDKTVRFWSLDSGHPRGTIVTVVNQANSENLLVAVSVDGHYSLSEDPDKFFKIVAEDLKGYVRDYDPSEFTSKFGWKNDPEKVRLDGR